MSWPIEEFESSGTKKALQISGAILSTLMKGDLLFIDGIEANMHPIMTKPFYYKIIYNKPIFA